MFRSFTLAAVASLIVLPTFAAAPCNLTISMNCNSGNCTATTTNIGSNMCSGLFITEIAVDVPPTQASVSGFQNSLGLTECFDSNSFPGLTLAFGACIDEASLGPGGSFTSSAHVTAGAGAPSPLPIVAVTGVFDDTTGDELALVYAFNDVATPSCTPQASVPSITQSGVAYNVSWSAVSDPSATFTVDESTSPDFTATSPSQPVSGQSKQFQHSVTNATAFYYRVHANSCNGTPGPNSATVSIVVQPVPIVTGRSGDVVTSFNSTTPVDIVVPISNPSGKTALDTVPFTASTDKPYLNVTPSSGTIPPGGTTVTVTANPTNLPPGANTGTLTVTSNGATVANKSVSISLVTPVTPGGKTTPPANALVIPVVTHVNSASGPFQSDVRVTNASPSAISYQVTYTPTRSDGTQTGKGTTVSIQPGQTIALNDIAKDFFGFGATGDPNDIGFGSLEIRPMNTSSTLTFASSRTFVTTAAGTFGQYIAAVPFSLFATKAVAVPIPGVPPPTGTPVLSLQQIAQSTKFRTNLGIVEGSGAAASGNIKIYDDNGTLLKPAIPYSLLPGEHQQLNQFLAANGITSLDDGRIEITVESATGAVSAYASVLDNITTDPLAVMPVQASQISATRYVLPGMADFANPGASNFHSDARFYNGGSVAVTVTPKYYPRAEDNKPAVSAAPFSIGAGQVKAFDNVLPTLFKTTTGTGGSIVLTTSSPSSLVATGRTYSIDPATGGTFGQFIPGVSPAQGIGTGDRALQILQLEESANFRTNVGLAELTGNPAHVRLTLILPDSKSAPIIEQDLAPNQFLQINRIIAGLNPGQSTYNGRITVEVTSGTGRVTAYGSVIDNVTSDPTFVPVQ